MRGTRARTTPYRGEKSTPLLRCTVFGTPLDITLEELAIEAFPRRPGDGAGDAARIQTKLAQTRFAPFASNTEWLF